MEKVLVGISGGVDSSVAALLLKNSGYQVVGVHFSLKNGVGDTADALAVCNALDIPLHTVDFSQVFDSRVFQPFINEYQVGKTPNLCVMCNKQIKFGALVDFANGLGITKIATGHYCKTVSVNGQTYLACAKDAQKDQTYFLNQVPASVLDNVLFPLADLSKQEVRALAERHNLVTAHKKGSSDICLMGDMKFANFIAPYMKPRTGDVVTDNGVKVGQHSGLYNFTIGQRKGLGLGGVKGESGRWFVVGKNTKTNVLTVSHGSEDALFTTEVRLEDCNFFAKVPSCTEKLFAKTRYSQQMAECTVAVDHTNAVVQFFVQQRAVTSGQYCVFYQNGLCLGGGKIV